MKSAVLLTAIFATFTASGSWAHAQLGAPAKHDQRVRRILDQRDIKYTIDADGDFKVIFDMGEERSQVAFIRSVTDEYRNFEIREILSPAYKTQDPDGALPADVANLLLEDSAKKKVGGWQKRGNLALFVTKIAADADTDSLWSALKATLESADEMEKSFSGAADEF